MAPAKQGAEWAGAVGLTNLVRRKRFENQNGTVTGLRSVDSQGRLSYIRLLAIGNRDGNWWDALPGFAIVMARIERILNGSGI